MKRFQTEVKTAVLPHMIELGRFAIMALTFLIYLSLLWVVSLIGHYYR